MTNDEPKLPERNFDDSVQLDDPMPFPGWVPSPSQIREWGQQIRIENERRRQDEPTAGALGPSHL